MALCFVRPAFSQSSCNSQADLVDVPSSLKGCDFNFPVSFYIFHEYPAGHAFQVTISYYSVVEISNFGGLTNVSTTLVSPNFYKTTGTFLVDQHESDPVFFQETLTLDFFRKSTWDSKPLNFDINITDLSCPDWSVKLEFGISMDRAYVDLRTTPLTKVSDLMANGFFVDPLGNFDPNIDVIIDDELIVDASFFISSVGSMPNEIILMPGARINVQGNFGMNFIKVYTCGTEMAEGIVTTPFTGLTKIENCEIHDCHYGINGKFQSPMIVRNTSFIDNYIGINLDMTGAPPGLNFLSSPVPFTGGDFGITDVTFTSENPKMAYPGMTHVVGDRGYAGIRLKNYDDFKLLGEENSFMSLANGIVADGSNFQVFRAFINGMGSTSSIYPRKGYGIYAAGQGNGNWMRIGRPWTEMAIENCPTGIFATNMAGTVDQCDIAFGNIGIMWTNSKNKDIFIRDNSIVAKRFGIYSSNNEPLIAQSSIRGNKIIVSTPNSVGINSFELLGAAKGGWRLIGNEIAIADANSTGIWYRNGIDGALAQNQISGNGSNSRGIQLQYTKNADVVQNTINAIGSDGIYSLGNVRDTMQCNILSSTQTGLHILDLNNDSKLMGNEFANHNIGLEYGSSNMPDASTGDQVHLGNLWDNKSMGAWGAFHHNQNGAFTSRFIVDPICDSDERLMPSLRNPGGWFTEDCTATLGFSCPDNGPTPTPGGEVPDGLDETVAGSNFTPARFVAPLRWKAEYRLLQKIADYPSLETHDGIYQAFKNSRANQAVGQLAAVGRQSRSIFELSQAQTIALEAATLDLNNRNLSLAAMDSSIRSGTYISPQDYQLALNNRILAAQNHGNLLSQYQQQAISRAQSLLAANNAITTANEVERNHKDVNAILLEMVINQTQPNSTQEEALKTIARQCPQMGGDAVYDARAALGYLAEQEIYDDEMACNLAFNALRPANDRKRPFLLKGVKLYPNPATDWVSVNDIDNRGTTVQVYDAMGRTILSTTVVDGRFYVGDLPEGLYRVRLFDAGRLILDQNLLRVQP